MITLIFSRHADHLFGQLSDEGRSQSEALADRLVSDNLVPDAILCSPAERAFQTATIIADRLKAQFASAAIQVVKKECLAYDFPLQEVDAAIAEISKTPGNNILAVTHEPLIEEFSHASDHKLRRIPNAGYAAYEINPQRPEIPLKFIAEYRPD